LRSWDRPESGGPAPPPTLRDRLAALPPGHPSSPQFDRRAPWDAPPDRPGISEDPGESGPEHYGDGVIDERVRAFPPRERATAEALAAAGATVIALPEDPGLRQRQPDALVDGRVSEFKGIEPGGSDASIKNQLDAARGQAPNVVVDARGSGVDEDAAALGMRRFLGNPWGRDHFASILIIGDGYVLGNARREEPGHGSA
jgi:hypothetical protein